MVSFTSVCEPEPWVIVFCVIVPSDTCYSGMSLHRAKFKCIFAILSRKINPVMHLRLSTR